MQRGSVYTIGKMRFPDGTEKPKHVIVLRSVAAPGASGNGQVAVVWANTDRRPDRNARPFEAKFGPAHGFHHATVVDGRWLMTLQMDDLTKGNHLLDLSPNDMRVVDRAIMSGLQLDP